MMILDDPQAFRKQELNAEINRKDEYWSHQLKIRLKS